MYNIPFWNRCYFNAILHNTSHITFYRVLQEGNRGFTELLININGMLKGCFMCYICVTRVWKGYYAGVFVYFTDMLQGYITYATMLYFIFHYYGYFSRLYILLNIFLSLTMLHCVSYLAHFLLFLYIFFLIFLIGLILQILLGICAKFLNITFLLNKTDYFCILLNLFCKLLHI